MKTYISPLSIEKIITGAHGKSCKYGIIDGNGERLALFENLYDAAICLRFIIGKSMSRNECDLAAKMLQNLEEVNTEQQTSLERTIDGSRREQDP